MFDYLSKYNPRLTDRISTLRFFSFIQTYTSRANCVSRERYKINPSKSSVFQLPFIESVFWLRYVRSLIGEEKEYRKIFRLFQRRITRTMMV